MGDSALLSYLVLGTVVGGLLGVGLHTIQYLNRPAWVRPEHSWHAYFAVGSVAGLTVVLVAPALGWTVPEWDLVVVALLGACVGGGELASRYRDEPTKAIFTRPAMLYIALNAVAAMAAFPLACRLQPTCASNVLDWEHVLGAGLGAMVLLRSSVFRVRIHDHDVDVGPSSFLQSVIDAADRAVDRVRAQERAWTVARVMENVAFDKALTALPPYMCALMQNLKPDEQNEFTEKIEKLRTGKQSDQVKVLTLGLLAMNQMGEGVLRAAVDSLAVEIRRAAERTSNAAVEAADAAKVAEERAAAAVTAAAMTAAAMPPEVPAEVKHAAAEATSAAVEAADAARAASDRTEVTAETALDTEAAVAASEGRATEHQRRATAGAGAESSDAVAPVPQTHLNGGPNRT